MNYKTLPNSSDQISNLTLGTWVFAGDCWGSINDQECLDVVETAIDKGINCIDTAPIYGNGKSEIIIGKALKGKRAAVIIATKCGLRTEGRKVFNDLSPLNIRREIDASLKRLQTDYIDIYQCHWPDPKIELVETLAELEKIKSEGKIRFIGVSNFDLKLLNKANEGTRLNTMQGQYSMLDRRVEKDVLPFCRENNLAFLAYGPLAGGILSGKYSQPPQFKGGDVRKFFYKYYDGAQFLAVTRLLKALKVFNKPFNQLALNWVRQQPGVTSVLVGCRTCKQVHENIAAMNWDISAQDLVEIKNCLDSFLSK